MENYMLTLSYEGTRYRGWQRQGNTGSTVQEKLETTLSRILGQPVEVAGCGRTDAGVHARRQVCSFRAETAMSCDELLALLRHYLPEDIGALALQTAPPRFHARLSCTGKAYVYRIRTDPRPDVFSRRFVLPYAEPLDLDAMRRAAALLCGKHDFAAFSSLRPGKKSTVRELRSIEVLDQGEELRLVFHGDGFLYNMVRILVGTLLEVGAGRLGAEEMRSILASRDRTKAGPTAPARGLTLWEVFYS